MYSPGIKTISTIKYDTKIKVHQPKQIVAHWIINKQVQTKTCKTHFAQKSRIKLKQICRGQRECANMMTDNKTNTKAVRYGWWKKQITANKTDCGH